MVSDRRRITPEEDAVGQEMLAYYNGKNVCEIIERSDGYFDAGRSVETYFSVYNNWPNYEKKAMDFVKGRVLDIGCGAGRHSIYLQERGFDVLGIDISPLAVNVCRLRGLNKAEVMSIDEIRFGQGSFDSIIMMGNNFGLFGNCTKARRLLKRFHKMTSIDALIVAATNDVSKTSNPFHLKYQELNVMRGRMRGQIRMRVMFQKYATNWFDYLMVSKKEMVEILHGTGWRIREFIDSEASYYVAIIEKEPT